MSPAAAFFCLILALQAAFTISVVCLVARRFPQRATVYRFVAPAAVPILMFLVVSLSYLRSRQQIGLSLEQVPTTPIAQFFIAYGVLWLIGVIIAGFVIRFVRR